MIDLSKLTAVSLSGSKFQILKAPPKIKTYRNCKLFYAKQIQ